jgi:hypothetical protein
VSFFEQGFWAMTRPFPYREDVCVIAGHSIMDERMIFLKKINAVFWVYLQKRILGTPEDKRLRLFISPFQRRGDQLTHAWCNVAQLPTLSLIHELPPITFTNNLLTE